MSPFAAGAALRFLLLVVLFLVVVVILLLFAVLVLLLVVVAVLFLFTVLVRVLVPLLIVVPLERLVVLELLLLGGIELRQVVLLVLGIGRLLGFLAIGVVAGGHVVEDRRDLLKGVDGLALDEIGVLVLADLVLDLVDGELGLEVEQVVEHLDAAAREVVEQVGVRAVLLVEDVGQGEELFLGVEERLLHALEPHAA